MQGCHAAGCASGGWWRMRGCKAGQVCRIWAGAGGGGRCGEHEGTAWALGLGQVRINGRWVSLFGGPQLERSCRMRLPCSSFAESACDVCVRSLSVLCCGHHNLLAGKRYGADCEDWCARWPSTGSGACLQSTVLACRPLHCPCECCGVDAHRIGCSPCVPVGFTEAVGCRYPGHN